jgi:septal ring factor EnvC (AmiA/AmiB activator)
MGKLLKPLVIVLLVLSIVSLVLGIMLFSKREVLKGRTLKLEDAAANVAQKLHFENFNSEQLKHYDQMDAPLQQLAVYADTQYEELQLTKDDLENTKADLARVQSELQGVKTELANTQQQVEQLQTDIENKEVELAQAYTQVDQLEQDKESLQIEIDDLNNKLVQAEDETRDLQDQVATLEQTISNMEIELGDRPTQTLPKGLTGRILVVNPYWNFVILDIGSEAGLAPNAEMLVHRDDRLIGKVRISSVEEDMAVAEILNDWEQVPIREGDYVLF